MIPTPLQKTNQDRIVRTQELMSSNPSRAGRSQGSRSPQVPQPRKSVRDLGGPWSQAQVVGGSAEGRQEGRGLCNRGSGEGFGSQEGTQKGESLKLGPSVKRQNKNKAP